MDNAEEVMQLLEEFNKIKPKDIPRELEDYLSYVAKTGDPVFQWSLVKYLFREKFVTVITDFYESTLTVELPPCPNVEPFNYERMKTSLLERFESFSSAPFTVQRICELLTNPKKEYNRADKFMRAIEKNVLVVSTREPGTGKRALECDSQSETVLNGIPSIRIMSDSGFIHVATDLPFLGAPPASNDVTVETSEHNTTVGGRIGHNVETSVNAINSDNDKPWPTQDLSSISEESKTNLVLPNPVIDNVSVDSNTCTITTKSVELRPNDVCDSDTNFNSKEVLTLLSNESAKNDESGGSTDEFTNETIPPDSIDSSDSSQDGKEEQENDKVENEDIGLSSCDENEVSSTPGAVLESPLIQAVPDPTDSEAEATESNIELDAKSSSEVLLDNEINSSETMQSDESKSLCSISEITDNKLDDVDLECNEISGTVDSPVLPEVTIPSLQEEKDVDQSPVSNDDMKNSQNPAFYPDSSNDVGIQEKDTGKQSENPQPCGEADSVSEANSEQSEDERKRVENNVQHQVEDESNVTHTSEIISPKLNFTKDNSDSTTNITTLPTSSTQLEEINSQGPLDSVIGMIDEVQSSSEADHISIPNHYKEDNHIVKPVPNIPDSQQQIEDIALDTNCEGEDEAMEVDDTSNQMMMISEGENEGEPMDQSDQQQS